MVVNKKQMAVVLLDFRKKWDAKYPVNAQHVQNMEMRLGLPYGPRLGPWEWISLETGIDASVIGKISRGQMPIISFTKAEKILLALGLQSMLDNDEIEVFKNPNWTWRQFRLWKAEQMR